VLLLINLFPVMCYCETVATCSSAHQTFGTV